METKTSLLLLQTKRGGTREFKFSMLTNLRQLLDRDGVVIVPVPFQKPSSLNQT